MTPYGGSGNYEYLWSNNATVQTVNVEPMETTTYTVTVSDLAMPSCTTEVSCTVNVRAQFTAGAIATEGQSVCFGATTGFDEIGSDTPAFGGDTNITYQWYHNDVAITMNGNEATYTPTSEYTSTAGAHTFTRKAKDGTCNTEFEPSTGSWVLTVYEEFVPGSINSEGEAICKGSSASAILSNSQAGGGNGTITYQWQVNTGEVGTFEAADGTNNQLNYTPTAQYTGVAGVYIFRRVAFNACNTDGVSTEETYTLTVYETPTVEITTILNNPYCPNKGDVTLEATATGATPYTYTWSGTLTPKSTQNNAATFTIPAQCGQSYSIGVSVVDNNGCTATAEPVTLTVNDETAPVIGTVSALTAIANNNCTYIVPDYMSDGVVTVTETCSNYTLSQSPVAGAPIAQGTTAATQDVVITATNACGLSNSKTVTITVPAKLALTTVSARKVA